MFFRLKAFNLTWYAFHAKNYFSRKFPIILSNFLFTSTEKSQTIFFGTHTLLYIAIYLLYKTLTEYQENNNKINTKQDKLSLIFFLWLYFPSFCKFLILSRWWWCGVPFKFQFNIIISRKESYITLHSQFLIVRHCVNQSTGLLLHTCSFPSSSSRHKYTFLLEKLKPSKRRKYADRKWKVVSLFIL